MIHKDTLDTIVKIPDEEGKKLDSLIKSFRKFIGIIHMIKNVSRIEFSTKIR